MRFTLNQKNKIKIVTPSSFKSRTCSIRCKRNGCPKFS